MLWTASSRAARGAWVRLVDEVRVPVAETAALQPGAGEQPREDEALSARASAARAIRVAKTVVSGSVSRTVGAAAGSLPASSNPLSIWTKNGTTQRAPSCRRFQRSISGSSDCEFRSAATRQRCRGSRRRRRSSPVRRCAPDTRRNAPRRVHEREARGQERRAREGRVVRSTRRSRRDRASQGARTSRLTPR